MLHIDSWEMGPQNWCDDFREPVRKTPGLRSIALHGCRIRSRCGAIGEISERFLWDYRMTAQELGARKSCPTSETGGSPDTVWGFRSSPTI